MTQISRNDLKKLFKTGAKPSGDDFQAFIDSTLNIKEDGIEKPLGADTPLKITAQGAEEKLLDFYAGETKTWSINQKSGLNISNAGVSKLFIDSGSGNVGIGTTSPRAKLTISGGLHVGGDSDPGQKNLQVDGIVKTPALDFSLTRDNHLEVDGALYRYGGSVYLTVDDIFHIRNSGGDEAKIIFDTKSGKITASAFQGEGAFVTGMIIMWSGSKENIPSGWALCDGTTKNGKALPNLTDRFIVGAGNKYKMNDTGGKDQVRLDKSEMPPHNHTNGNYKYLLQKNKKNTPGSLDNAGDEPNVATVGEMQWQGGGNPHENRPPYYALCFIMKL